MRRIATLLLGLSAAVALHPRLRLATRPLAVAVRMSSQEDLSKHTVVQLKERLRAAGLPVSGRKAELVDRLFSAPSIPAAAPSAALGSLASSGGTYPPIAIEACKS